MKTITKIFLLLFIIVSTSCKSQEVKAEKRISNQTMTNAFENHLIPSIQIENEPRYFNIIERMKY